MADVLEVTKCSLCGGGSGRVLDGEGAQRGGPGFSDRPASGCGT